MLKIFLISLIVSSSLFASIDRTFKSAAYMYLDYHKGLNVSKLIKKSSDFYNTKLSLIDRNERADQLIYLGAEINDGELFLLEIRFDGSNMILLKKSYRVRSSDIKIEKDYTLYSTKQFHLTDKDIGLWSIIIGNTTIASFNDSEETRRLVYELEVALSQNYYAKKYVYRKPKPIAVKSEFSNMKKNSLFQTQENSDEIKECMFYEVLREELPLRENGDPKAIKLGILHKGDYLRSLEYCEYSWCKVKLPRTQRVGWVWQGEKVNPTIKKFKQNCI